MLTPWFGRELSGDRARTLRAEAAGSRRSRGRRRHRQRGRLRGAVSLPLPTVRRHLIGGEEVR